MTAPDLDPRFVLDRRAKAATATLRQFEGLPFRLSVRDCVRMVAAHLRRLGYQVKLPPSGSYRSVRAAMKSLADRGYANLGEALDDMGLERIAPAAATVGDIIEMPSGHPLGALVIALTNGRVFGYHENAVGAVVQQPNVMLTAWRVRA